MRGLYNPPAKKFSFSFQKVSLPTESEITQTVTSESPLLYGKFKSVFGIRGTSHQSQVKDHLRVVRGDFYITDWSKLLPTESLLLHIETKSNKNKREEGKECTFSSLLLQNTFENQTRRRFPFPQRKPRQHNVADHITGNGKKGTGTLVSFDYPTPTHITLFPNNRGINRPGRGESKQRLNSMNDLLLFRILLTVLQQQTSSPTQKIFSDTTKLFLPHPL